MNAKEKSRMRQQRSRESKTQEEKDQARLSDNAARSIVRGNQTEEEKDLASGQLRARMSELRGKHTMAERKEARTANSFKKRLANAATRSAAILGDPSAVAAAVSRQSYKNQRNADARHANNQYYGRQ